MIKVLRQLRPNITKITKSTFLIAADLSIIISDLEGLKICMDAGVNITACDAYANTGLHMAAGNGHLEVIKIIAAPSQVLEVQHLGINSLINIQNQSLNTPLHWAVLNKQIDVVKTLIELGSDASLENEEGSTPLSLAILSEHEELVEILAPHTKLKASQEKDQQAPIKAVSDQITN